MRMKLMIALAVGILAGAGQMAKADEGMWMIHAIDAEVFIILIDGHADEVTTLQVSFVVGGQLEVKRCTLVVKVKRMNVRRAESPLTHRQLAILVNVNLGQLVLAVCLVMHWLIHCAVSNANDIVLLAFVGVLNLELYHSRSSCYF